MAKIEIGREGFFPLRKLEVSINDQVYRIGGNQTVTVDLQEKEYVLSMKMDWWKTFRTIKVKRDTKKIQIKYCMPDFLFWFFLFTILLLAFLTILHIVNGTVLAFALLIFVMLQLYYLLIKKSNYFFISTE